MCWCSSRSQSTAGLLQLLLGPSVLNRLGHRGEGSGGVAAGWTLPKAAAKGGKEVVRERLSARDERASRLGQDEVVEEGEKEMPGDGEPCLRPDGGGRQSRGPTRGGGYG